MGGKSALVSVIIPYYNSEGTIFRALESVRDQIYQNYEIIIINDGSKDNGCQIVNRYIQQYPDITVKHVSQENSGPSKARNKGIGLAKGKYIAFLDSDDTWEPDKLEYQIGYMENHPDVVISGTNYFYGSGNSDEMLKYQLTPEIIEANFKSMLFKVFFCMCTVVIRRDIIIQDQIHFLDGKNYGEDLLFFLQIVRKYRGVRLSKPLTKLHKFLYGEGGLTKDLDRLLVHELDNVKILYSENRLNKEKISYALYNVLLVYSYMKHFVRYYKSRKYRN